MLKRKIMQTLREWKSNVGTKKKALVIKGLHQIGKTFIVRQCVKLGEYNIGENGNTLTLPYYLAFLLEE